MRRTLAVLLCFILSGCCSFAVTSNQKRACLRDDLAKNWGKEFPRISPSIGKDSILTNPDLELTVSDGVILKGLRQALTGQRISLGNGGVPKLEGDYIEILEVRKFAFMDDGTINVTLRGKARLEKLFAEITFIVDEISMAILPRVSRLETGEHYISLFGAITYLDVSSVPANIDRALANLATFELTKKYATHEIVRFDLAQMLDKKMRHPSSGVLVNPSIVTARVVAQNGRIVLQLDSK